MHRVNSMLMLVWPCIRSRKVCQLLLLLALIDNLHFKVTWGFFAADTSPPLRKLQHLVASHLPCLQTLRVQWVLSLLCECVHLSIYLTSLVSILIVVRCFSRWMLLVENMELQKEWVPEKGTICFVSALETVKFGHYCCIFSTEWHV